MAEFEDKCIFRVNVPGLGNIYWLFGLPDDGSPIIKRYTKILTDSCDLVLANYGGLNLVVNRTVSVIQTCRKNDAIHLGSQCNRLSKYTESTAIYICNFKDVAVLVAEKLHCAMGRLYYDRPPRVTEAHLMLNSISDTAAIVLQTTERQLSLLMKLSSVTREGFTAFLKSEDIVVSPSSCTLTDFLNGTLSEPDDAQTLGIFNEAVQKLFVFWEKLTEHLRAVSTMTNEIKENIPQANDENFDEFATKVIKISAYRIALKKLCVKYIDHMSPSNFRKNAVDTLPNDFDNLRSHFNDIEVHLLGDSDCDSELESSIQIYSCWIQPKLDTTVYRCSELAQEAKELVSHFDSTRASDKLIEIEQQSKHVAIMTTIYLKRLCVIESYAERQQECMMRNAVKLESDMKLKQDKLKDKEDTLNKAKQQIADYEAKKKSAEEKKKGLEKKRTDYAIKLRKLNKKSLRYMCTKELVKLFEEQVQTEKEIVHLNEKSCKKLHCIIKITETQMRRLKKEITSLSQEVEKLKLECDYSFERLQEMKMAIADLKKSIHSWNVLLANTEHGADRAVFVKKLIQRASRNKDVQRVLGSRGMVTALRNFIDAFTAVERLFEMQWQYIISYDYTCDMCNVKQRGLPLPVDDNTVVCCSCAHTLV